MVSICCITYNHELFIAKAIESFLMQKTMFEYEIMFRPDGTVDKGLDVKLRELRGSAEKTVHVSLFGKIWTTTP